MMSLSRWKVILVVLATVLGLLFSLPNVLPKSTLDSLPAFMPKKGLNLGLDLQGGSSLLLGVDTVALRAERLTNMTEDVRTSLRNERIAFTDLGQVNGEVTVRITDPGQYAQAQKVLRNAIGAALQGVPGGREVAVSTLPDQRIRLAFVPEAFA